MHEAQEQRQSEGLAARTKYGGVDMGHMISFIMNLHTTIAGKKGVGDTSDKPIPAPIYKPKSGKKGSKKKVSHVSPL